MNSIPTVVVAYIREGERYAPVNLAAIEAARSSGAQLILYDADSASRLSEPLPSTWSADNGDRPFGDRLTPEEIEGAGRHELAKQVRGARANGIDTFGWLASTRGAGEFLAYAEGHGADLLVVPEDLQDEGIFARLRGAPAPGEIEDKAERSVLTVPVGQPVDA